ARKLPAPSPACESVAANEAALLVFEITEARDVDAGAVRARVIGGRPPAAQLGDHAHDVAGHDLLAEVFAQHAARVGEAVRPFLTRRVQQDARRLEAPGAEHDDLAEGLFGLARQAVKVEHAFRLPVLV